MRKEHEGNRKGWGRNEGGMEEIGKIWRESIKTVRTPEKEKEKEKEVKGGEQEEILKTE